jgi:hypothetical protein
MQIPCVYIPGPAPAVTVANSYDGGIMGQDKDGDSRGKDKGKNSVVVRLGDIAAGLGHKQILGWVKVGETCQNECWDNKGQQGTEMVKVQMGTVLG